MNLTGVLWGAAFVVVLGFIAWEESSPELKAELKAAVQPRTKSPLASMLESARTRWEIAEKTPGHEDDCRAARTMVMYMERVGAMAVQEDPSQMDAVAKGVDDWQWLEKDACREAEEERRKEREHRELFGR